jgi:hypothetical protein
MEQQPIEVFFSYSREDKSLRDKLEKHLISLRRQGVISLWHDREIVAGSEWEEEIDRHMRTADIILLLVSPDFVASKYCYEVELPDAMARHEAEEAYVVPILLRPTAGWKNLSFAKLQVYPSGGKAVTLWGNEDEAFVDVAEGIAIAVTQLLEGREQRRREQERQEQKQINSEQIRQNRDLEKRTQNETIIINHYNNQASRKQNLTDFTVQIRHTTTNAVIATGVVVSTKGEIITCRHAVEMAGVDPLKDNVAEVGVVLPRTRSREEKVGRARVSMHFLKYDDDVVVLRLNEEMLIAPNEVAILGTASSSEGNPFRSYGFRRLDKSSGGYAEGTIMGHVPAFDGLNLQVDPIELRTRDIRPGMFGAAILDLKRNLVIGLVYNRWNPGDSSIDDNIAWAVDNYLFKILFSSMDSHIEIFENEQ